MEILVERDSNFLQSADGHLIIVQVGEERTWRGARGWWPR